MILKIDWQNEPLIVLHHGSDSSPVAAIVLLKKKKKVKVHIFSFNQMYPFN